MHPGAGLCPPWQPVLAAGMPLTWLQNATMSFRSRVSGVGSDTLSPWQPLRDMLVLLQHMRKNQYEEALFRCEDDRYELDMIIEQNASAIRAARPLCEEILKMAPEDKQAYRVPEKALSAIHYRIIGKIYGELPGPSLGSWVKVTPLGPLMGMCRPLIVLCWDSIKWVGGLCAPAAGQWL